MASEFWRKFWWATAFLVPLFLLSSPWGKRVIVNSSYLELIKLALSSAIFFLGLVFFRHAKHEIKARQYGMMTLVSLAVGAGYLFSLAAAFLPQLEGEFYLEISSLIWVLLFGHYLEARSSSAAGNALQEVAKLLPAEAHLVQGEQLLAVKVDQLKPGDLIRVKPGEKVPADGIIIAGEAHLNEAVITGESKPVRKGKGDQVIAGSICHDGSLTIEIQRVGENSTVGQIKQLIVQAQQTKPQTQVLADRAARWLTFIALSLALLAIIIWYFFVGQSLAFALTLAITVLVIACPHALGLAIPTVTTITTTLAAKNGLFIKDMSKLERIRAVNYVIMDKTGTLTQGQFALTGIIPLAQIKKERLLQLAASLEAHSAHPLAQAVVQAAQKRKLKLLSVSHFADLAGKGIEAKISRRAYLLGNQALMEERGLWQLAAEKISDSFSPEGRTVIYLASEKEILAAFLLEDQLRPESKQAITQLHQLGVKVAMLTGDHEGVAAAVAQKLGVDTYFANVLPADKYRYVKQLQDQGAVVMMVGDGVNDAPALTQADIGVAIGAGTDVAVEAGDIVLTRSNPQDIVRLIILGRKTYRKMIENLFWAVGYNAVALPAAAGLLAPWGFFLSPGLGAFLMSLSSVIVVINALRLKRVQLALTKISH